MVPAAKFPPSTPFTNQYAAVLLMPDTVAVNCCACPTCKLVLVGEMEIDTEGDDPLIETVALAVAPGWTTLEAVTTIGTDGVAAGAVYRPEEEIVPTVEFPPMTVLTIHRRSPLLVPETFAVNC